jgi:hypothetical protein
VLLSGVFVDTTGATRLIIVDNVWSAIDGNWDVEVVGPRITIRRGRGDIALKIKVMPPHTLAIEKIDMQFGEYFLKGDVKTLRISRDGQNWNGFSTATMRGCEIGISLG